MDMTQLVALIGAIVAVFGPIGAIAKWAADKFSALSKDLKALEDKYDALHEDHVTQKVQLARYRIAFQMVAGELARKSPGNTALSMAKSILDDAFQVDPDLPKELREILGEIDRKTEPAPAG